VTDETFRPLGADEYLKLSLEQRLEYIQQLTADLKAGLDRQKKAEKLKVKPSEK
jgi:hypothetical protein